MAGLEAAVPVPPRGARGCAGARCAVGAVCRPGSREGAAAVPVRPSVCNSRSSKTNSTPDLCAPGVLCAQRQAGIFSEVCSRSRKNSQMGITLTRCMSCCPLWTVPTKVKSPLLPPSPTRSTAQLCAVSAGCEGQRCLLHWCGVAYS